RGFVGARRTGRIGLGVLAAVWAAMSSSLILVSYGFLLAYLFMGRMAAIEAPDFARTGVHDPQALPVADAIFNAGADSPRLDRAPGELGRLQVLRGRAQPWQPVLRSV